MSERFVSAWLRFAKPSRDESLRHPDFGRGFASAGFYLARFFVANEIADTFEETHGNVYIKLQWGAFLDATFVALQAMVLFFANIKFLKLLRFNRRVSMFGATLSRSRQELTYFGFVFASVYIGLVGALYMLLKSNLRAFSTFVSACKEAFSAMLGKFDFQDIVDNSALAPWLFFLFNILQAMILINMFITIVTVLFQEIKEDAGKRSNDYEVFDYVKLKAKEQVGMRADGREKKSRAMEDNGRDMSVLATVDDKTDRLLKKLSKSYLKQDIDLAGIETQARRAIRKEQRQIQKEREARISQVQLEVPGGSRRGSSMSMYAPSATPRTSLRP